MKHLFLLVLLSLWAAAGPARAAPLAPADTLPGHAHLVRTISASLCEQLAHDRTTDVARLSSADAMAYAQRLFTTAMQSDSVRLLAMMTTANERGTAPAQVAQLLGHDAMQLLTQNCPAARPLVVRLAQTEQGQRAMAAQVPRLPPAEQKVLLPITAALCTELSAHQSAAAFARLSPAGRRQVFMTALHKAFKPQTAALLRYYGPAKLDAQLRSGELDGKIGTLMPTRAGCGQYLLLIGVDRMAGQVPKP